MLTEIIMDLVYDPHGICIVSAYTLIFQQAQKLLIESKGNYTLNSIWEKISPHLLNIIQDLYGNYLIQLIIELNPSQKIINQIIEITCENVNILSLQKVSSNVVERCIEISSNVSLINVLS